MNQQPLPAATICTISESLLLLKITVSNDDDDHHHHPLKIATYSMAYLICVMLSTLGSKTYPQWVATVF